MYSYNNVYDNNNIDIINVDYDTKAANFSLSPAFYILPGDIIYIYIYYIYIYCAGHRLRASSSEIPSCISTSIISFFFFS